MNDSGEPIPGAVPAEVAQSTILNVQEAPKPTDGEAI